VIPPDYAKLRIAVIKNHLLTSISLQYNLKERGGEAMSERETIQLFDRTLKRLLNASNRAIVHFVNGLSGTRYPPDSTVDHLIKKENSPE
jgi:hypothetical protein